MQGGYLYKRAKGVERDLYHISTENYTIIANTNQEILLPQIIIRGVPFTIYFNILFRSHTNYQVRFRIPIDNIVVQSITIPSALTRYILTARDGFLTYTTPTGFTRINFLADNFTYDLNSLQGVSIVFSIVNGIQPLYIGVSINTYQFNGKNIILRENYE